MADLFDKPDTPEIFQYETLGNGKARVTVYDADKCCQVTYYNRYGKIMEADVLKIVGVVGWLNKQHERGIDNV